MKRSIKVAFIVGTAVMISLGAQSAFAASKGAAGTPHSRSLGKAPNHPILDWTPVRTPAQVRALRVHPDANTVTSFTTTVKDGKKSFSYTMIGKNPFIHTANPKTTVPTTLVPVIIKFSNGDTWDPTAVTSCDTESAMARVESSPLFNTQAWKFGGTKIGTHQYIDAFQRAEFYNYTKTGGANPTYSTALSATVHAPLTLNVPNADAAEFSGVPCGNNLLGDVDINYIDAQLQSYITGTLGSGASTTFPLFVTTDVVEYQGGNPNNCCVLGYHGAMTNNGNFQFYGIAEYDTSSEFTAVSDTSAMSHEIGEAMNDPNGSNPTKPWGHIGQVSGCQNNFEVGDPLSGTIFTDTLNSFTYHLQELAFFSWFYHSKPGSFGVNGWYSNRGKFRTAAAACT